MPRQFNLKHSFYQIPSFLIFLGKVVNLIAWSMMIDLYGLKIDATYKINCFYIKSPKIIKVGWPSHWDMSLDF